jgi:uncharacterized oxidoreductase
MNISGNTILITGGGGGLGLALAKAFVDSQNTVIICDKSQDNIDLALQKLEAVHGYVCDITDSQQRNDLFEKVCSRFPEINILINNAATCIQMDFTQPLPAGEIETEITTNITAPLELIRLFLPLFLNKQSAAIINICSECGVRPFYSLPVYTGTKAGLVFFTEALRSRLKHQIKNMTLLISEVYPPTLDTALNAQWHDIKKISPDIFARSVLAGIQRDKAIIWGTTGEVRVFHSISRWLITLLRAPRKLIRSAKRLLRGEPIAW